MTPIERFQAFHQAKQLKYLRHPANYYRLDAVGRYLVDKDNEEVDLMSELMSTAKYWELYEEPKPAIKLTPEHVGKRIKFNNGDIELITAFQNNLLPNGFSYKTANYLLTCYGKTQSIHYYVVEILD